MKNARSNGTKSHWRRLLNWTFFKLCKVLSLSNFRPVLQWSTKVFSFSQGCTTALLMLSHGWYWRHRLQVSRDSVFVLYFSSFWRQLFVLYVNCQSIHICLLWGILKNSYFTDSSNQEALRGLHKSQMQVCSHPTKQQLLNSNNKCDSLFVAHLQQTIDIQQARSGCKKFRQI